MCFRRFRLFSAFHFRPLVAATLFLAGGVLTSPSYHSAWAATSSSPLAVITKSSGNVTVRQGTKQTLAKAGTTLTAGARVEARGGNATVFFLSGTEKRLSGTASLLITTSATQSKGDSLLRGAYVGLSQGFASGGKRVAATMREGQLEPVAPLDTALLDDSGSLKWDLGGLDQTAITGYEVEVLTASKAIARLRTSRREVPLAALAFPRDTMLRWRITPYARVGVAGTKVQVRPIMLWRSRDVNFSVASPATVRSVRAALLDIDRNAKASPAQRKLARAALLTGSNFYAAALQELQGVDTPEAKALRLALLPAIPKPTQNAAPQIKDEALERDIDAKDVLTPNSLKLYKDPYGKFSIRIPISWGYWIFDYSNKVRQTLWSARQLSSPRLSVATAAHVAGGAPALNGRLLNKVRQDHGVLTRSPVQNVRWNNRQVLRQTWKVKYGDLKVQGTSWMWSEKGVDVVAIQGEFPGDAHYTRQLATCLASLQIHGNPSLAKPIPNPWNKVTNDSLLAEMQRVNNVHHQLDIIQQSTQGSAALWSRSQKVLPAEFSRYHALYVAAHPISSEKSQAASQAAGIAAALGWQAVRQNRFSQAQHWFARRTTFDRYAYANSIAILRSRMAANEARIQKIRVAPAPLAIAERLNALLDVRLALQMSYIFGARMLAYNHSDARTLEEFSRAAWHIVCERIDNKALGGVYTSATPLFVKGDKVLAAFSEDWRLKQRSSAAETLLALSEAALLRYDFDRATAYAKRSLAWQRALPVGYPRRHEIMALRTLAVIAERTGNYPVARTRYEELIKVVRVEAARNSASIATVKTPTQRMQEDGEALLQEHVLALNNLGAVLKKMSDFDGSLARFRQALARLDTPPIGAGKAQPVSSADSTSSFSEKTRWNRTHMRAIVLGNMANLEMMQGNLDEAERLLDKSSKLLLSIGADQKAALAIFNRATIFLERGQDLEAAKAIRTANRIFAQLRDSQYLAATTRALARLEYEDGRGQKADQLGAQALGFARLSDNADDISDAANVLASIRIAHWQSTPAKARDSKLLASAQRLLKEADTADLRSGLVESTYNTLMTRAGLQEARGDLTEALTTLKKAISRVEAIRANLDSDSAFSNLRSVSDLYERTVRLQLRLGLNADAFDTLSRARSKRLFDSLSLPNLNSPDPALRELLKRAAKIEETQTRLRTQIQAESELTGDNHDSTKIALLREQLAANQAEYFSITQRITAQRPAMQRAFAVSPLALKRAQATLPAGLLLLQYAPVGKQLYIFAITRTSLKVYALPTSATSVLAQAKAIRTALNITGQTLAKGGAASAPENDEAFVAASSALYGALVAPVASEWKQAKVVAIVPNGELYYLPFHALAHKVGNGLKFWIEEKPLTYLVGADVLATVKHASGTPKGGVLAMGDPPGADLPAARQEVATVARLFPASQALVGASASKEVLIQNKTLRKRVLHLAAHGVLNPVRPDRSFIQLAPDAQKNDDGKLRVSEIYGLNLKGVDLVTLSACQTALGVAKPNGTEITGLAESFASAGTRSVVASLWNVEDTSTRTLMERFYQGLADGEPKAQALQEAQIALLKNPKTRHPFFWAPFELLGDWR